MTENHKNAHNANVSTPGVAVIRVLDDGKAGRTIDMTGLPKMVDGKDTTDPGNPVVVHR